MNEIKKKNKRYYNISCLEKMGLVSHENSSNVLLIIIFWRKTLKEMKKNIYNWNIKCPRKFLKYSINFYILIKESENVYEKYSSLERMGGSDFPRKLHI